MPHFGVLLQKTLWLVYIVVFKCLQKCVLTIVLTVYTSLMPSSNLCYKVFEENNDTFEFQEFRPLEIGWVFEVRIFFVPKMILKSWRQKCFCLFFCLHICFCLQLSLPSCLLRLLQQLQKRILKPKPRFTKGQTFKGYSTLVYMTVNPGVKSRNFYILSSKFWIWIFQVACICTQLIDFNPKEWHNILKLK